MENKKRISRWIWILIIALVLIISFFVFRGGEETQQPGGQQTQTLENAPDSEFANLETPDDIFSEIDDALGFIE